MQSAAPPQNEAKRLRAVHSYRGVERVEALDAIVRAAARTCGTSAAAVSVVTETHQVFVRAVGTDLQTIPRDISLCAHAILQPTMFEVEDTKVDQRFADNPLVTSPVNLRFYAAAPLINRDGLAIGTLCVFDSSPRKLTPAQHAQLTTLAQVGIDILEARRDDDASAEAVVRPSLASQSEFHHLAEELTDVGHWHYDLVSQNLYWSAQLYRILGHTPGTFKLTPDAAIQGYTSEEKARVQDIMSAAIAGGQPFDYDVSILRPDGQVRKLHSRGRCEVDPVTGSTTAVFGVCQDITERERMREHFLRQERLVAAGTLASGVGHEINNPLSFVATNLEFALDELRSIASVHGEVAHPLEEVLLALSEAKDGAHRIRKIVRGLQSFAHHQAPTAPTSVQAAIDSGAEMAMHELRHKARLEVHTETVPQVLADEGGLTHVITNLLVNAAQAFEAHDPTTNVVELHTRLGEDGRVTISVSDNGPGIPADVFPRIFDPFFTTKPVGHGSGLGLSLCHTIVSSIGGEIRCESVVGKGTTFVILLPPAAVAARASEQPRSGTTPIARGRILLIDDEATLLRAITRLLRPTHEVNAITDPREALTLLLDPRTSYDVIFCDLMMPHVTGMDLFRIVSEQRPELAERFVFMTAGAISDATRSFLAASQNPRVDKPFSSQTLRALAQKMVNKFAVQGAERAGAGLR